MTIHFIDAEIDLQASPVDLQQAIATELEKRGEPLRWAITAIDTDRQKAQIEAVVTTETGTSEAEITELGSTV